MASGDMQSSASGQQLSTSRKDHGIVTTCPLLGVQTDRPSNWPTNRPTNRRTDQVMIYKKKSILLLIANSIIQ